MNKDVLGLIERYLIPKKYWIVKWNYGLCKTVGVSQSKETAISIATDSILERHGITPEKAKRARESLDKYNTFSPLRDEIISLVYQEISIYKKID